MKNKNIVGYFYESTAIPVCMCQADGTSLFSHPHSFFDAYTQEFLQNCIGEFEIQKHDPDHPLIRVIRPAFLLGIAKCSDNDYLLLGPVSSIKIEQIGILDFCRNTVRPDAVLEFTSTVSRTPVMNYRQFVSSVAMAVKLCTGHEINREEIALSNEAIVPTEPEIALTQQVFEQRENLAHHVTYSFEETMLAAVEAGDVAQLKAIILQPVTGRTGQMSSNILRQEKYTFIAGVTLVSRAAVRGGMSYEAACSLSDIYCQKMDSLQRVQDIPVLTYQMMLDFCQQVDECQGKPGLCSAVRKCCEYISVHLHEDIPMDALAQVSGFCSKSISQKFLAETGLSAPEYIHREKMREAAQLLEYSNHSLSEISNYLQYSSQSYFSKIFKTFYKETPKVYRNQHKKI